MFVLQKVVYLQNKSTHKMIPQNLNEKQRFHLTALKLLRSEPDFPGKKEAIAYHEKMHQTLCSQLNNNIVNKLIYDWK